MLIGIIRRARRFHRKRLRRSKKNLLFLKVIKSEEEMNLFISSSSSVKIVPLEDFTLGYLPKTQFHLFVTEILPFILFIYFLSHFLTVLNNSFIYIYRISRWIFPLFPRSERLLLIFYSYKIH